MEHRGVEYRLRRAGSGLWKWRFRLGEKDFAGRTRTNLQLMAERRVTMRIDRELKARDGTKEKSAGPEIISQDGSR
jgi:hypothetical protein